MPPSRRHYGRSRPDPDDPLDFPNLVVERARARELFDIDIETSLKDWMETMGVDRRQRRARPRRYLKYATLDLTERERQVVALAAAGYGEAEAGSILFVSSETIKSHRRNIISKLGSHNTTQSVVLAILLGEVDFDLLREHIFRDWD